MVTILMVFESAMHVRNCIRNELLRALGKKMLSQLETTKKF